MSLSQSIMALVSTNNVQGLQAYILKEVSETGNLEVILNVYQALVNASPDSELASQAAATFLTLLPRGSINWNLPTGELGLPLAIRASFPAITDEVFALLLENPMVDFNAEDHSGESARFCLHHLVMTGQDAKCRMLLKSGKVTHLDDVNNSGMTPLMLAVAHSEPKCMDALLQFGGDKINFNVVCDSESDEEKNHTAFSLALRMGSLELAKKLAAHPRFTVGLDDMGLDLTIQDCKADADLHSIFSLPCSFEFEDGSTIAQNISHMNHVQAMRILLKHPHISINGEKSEGMSAIECAAKLGHLEMFRLLASVPERLADKPTPAWEEHMDAPRNGQNPQAITTTRMMNELYAARSSASKNRSPKGGIKKAKDLKKK